MPTQVATPFGTSWQSDPRDAVAARNFAIMQQLAALSPARDVAQIEANARVKAGELEAQKSQAWSQLQASMQDKSLAAQQSMNQMNLDARRAMSAEDFTRQQQASDTAFARGKEMADYADPKTAYARKLLGGMGAPGTDDITLSPDEKRAMAGFDPAPYRGQDLPSIQLDIANGLSDVGRAEPYGKAEFAPTGLLDAALTFNPATGPTNLLFNAVQGIGNLISGQPDDVTKLKSAANALSAFLTGGGDGTKRTPEAARAMTAQAIRQALSTKYGSPQEVDAVLAQVLAP